MVWLDLRTEETVERLKKESKGDINVLRDRCGLPISTYFSAVKVRNNYLQELFDLLMYRNESQS